MTHKDKESISNARKVWIFKMLLKKHGCKVRLDKDFRFASSGQKIEFFRVILDMQNGKTCVLTVMTKHGLALIEIPYKYNISYADVLDSILDAMKKTKSDCELRSINRWHYINEEGVFLKKDVSLEELNIELDLAYLNVLK